MLDSVSEEEITTQMITAELSRLAAMIDEASEGKYEGLWKRRYMN